MPNTNNTNWLRYRFRTTADDYRPVKWPPPGPYWCTGYDPEDQPIIVAYAPPDASIRDYWPEYRDAEWTSENEIAYTSRFPQPEWWPPEKDDTNQ